MTQSPPEGTDVSVQVALRVRPMNDSEMVQRTPAMRNLPSDVLSLSPNLPRVTVVPYQRHFTYDYIFGTDSTQQGVYDECVSRLMDKFLDGYNATILAYGQTSSGKTFTMGTGLGEGYADSDQTRGIVPRAAAALFGQLNRMHPDEFRSQVQVSFLEVYNEDLIDLLSITSRDGPRNTVTIREDTRGNIIWHGVREQRVRSAQELLDCLENGSALRQTGSTDMNQTSSRSHAIFSVTVKQEKWVPNNPGSSAGNNSQGPSGSRLPMRAPTPNGDKRSATPTGRRSALGGRSTPSGLPRPGSMYGRPMNSPTLSAEPSVNGPASGEGQWVTVQSKFHFVDLAGSERLKRTNAVGDRAKEGISINAGLSALGNVISALGDTSRKVAHVPYRDSKLTRLLQDSLGGNSQTLMIACVSPAASNLTETINTLKYANRARNIKNQVTQNQEASLDVDFLQAQIAKLKAEIRQLKTMSVISDDTDYMQQAVTHETSFLRKRNESLEQELDKVNVSYSQLEAQFEKVSQELTLLQDQQDAWRQQHAAALAQAGVQSFASDAPRPRPPSLSSIRGLTESGSTNFQREVEPVIEEYEKVVLALEEQLREAREAIAVAEAQSQITAAKLRFEETVRESNAIVIAELKSRVGELQERESGSVAYIRELEGKVRRGVTEIISEDAEGLRRQLAKERSEMQQLRQQLQTHNDPDVLALVETVTELEEKILQMQRGSEARQRRRRPLPNAGAARPQTEFFLAGQEPAMKEANEGDSTGPVNAAIRNSTLLASSASSETLSAAVHKPRHRRGSSLGDISSESLALQAVTNNPQQALEKINHLDRELETQRERCRSLSKEHSERVKSILAQEATENEARRREREAVEKDLTLVRSRLVAVEAELAAARAALDPENAERVAEIQERIRDVQEESEHVFMQEQQRHEAELAELESKMADMQAEATQLREEEHERHKVAVEKLQNELTAMRAQAEKAGKMRSMDAKIISALRDKISMVDAELKLSEQQLTRMRERSASEVMFTDGSSVPPSPSVRESELATLVEELEQKTEILKQARAATAVAAESEQNAQAEQIAALEQRVIDVAKELEFTRRTDRAEHARQVSAMVKKIAQLENELLEAREFHEAAAAADAQELEILREQVDAKVLRIHELEDILEEQSDELTAINNAKQEGDKLAEALNEQLATLKAAHEVLQERIQQQTSGAEPAIATMSEEDAQRIRLLSAESADLRRANERMQAQLQRLENANRFSTDNSEVQALQEEISQLESTNYRLLEQLEKVTGAGEASTQFLTLEEEIQRLESTNQHMVDQVQILEHRMQELDAQKAAESQRAGRVEAELLTVQNQFRDSIASLSSGTPGHEEVEEALRCQITEQERAHAVAIETLHEQLSLLSEAKIECARELEEIRVALTESQEAAAAQARHDEERVASMNEELATLQSAHSTELERMQTACQALEEARTTAETRVADLSAQLQSHLHNDSTTKNEQENIVVSLREAVSELETANAGTLKQLTELQQHLTQLESENGEYKELIGEMETSLSRSEESSGTGVSKLEEQLRDVQHRHSEEMSALQSQLAEAQTASESVQQRVTELEAVVEKARADKKADEEILAALELTNNEQTERITALCAELAEAKKESATADTDGAREILATLEKELVQLEGSMAVSRAEEDGEVTGASSAVQVLLRRVRAVEEARQSLEKQSADYQADATELEALVGTLTDDNQRLTEQLNASAADVSSSKADELNERVSQLEEERAQLTEANERYHSEVQQLEEEMVQVAEINQELEKEVSRMLETLQQMESTKEHESSSRDTEVQQLCGRLVTHETTISQQTKLIKTQEERIIELELSVEAMHRQQMTSPSRRPSKRTDDVAMTLPKHKLAANGSLTNIDVSPPPTPPPRVPPPPTPVPTSSPPSPTPSRSPSPPSSSGNGPSADELRLRSHLKQMEGDLRGHIALIESLEKSLTESETTQRDLESNATDLRHQVDAQRIENHKMAEAMETLQRKMDEMRGMFEGERVKGAQLLEKNRALERQMLELKAKKSKLLCF